MNDVDRRSFLRMAAATTGGFLGLRDAVAANLLGFGDAARGYGELVEDPAGILDLPTGFSYRIISRWGEEMDDGLLVPHEHDGMAAFDGGPGRTILVRNHEIGIDADLAYGAFGPNLERLGLVDRSKFFDPGSGDRPVLGGTTTIVYDQRSGTVEKHFLSLAGTGRNCAGGPTPWNSWITCEEWTQKADEACAKDHGWCFEVPATDQIGLATPRPLRGLGRFHHEAIAVAPDGRCVYLTEDRNDGLLYRFVPDHPGRLAEGGRLQALVVRGRPSIDLRNWIDPATEVPIAVAGQGLPVEWIDLDLPESPDDDLRFRGHDAGAARFARGEGMWTGQDEILFACTTGGVARIGQIWKYRPSPAEGLEGEHAAPGTLELSIEATEGGVIENADNLTIAPWGDVFVCEDGPPGNGLVRVTPEGEVDRFALNRLSGSELAGACFSPDGNTLFVNIQHQGITVAIEGRWRSPS
jgi:secreted PhoX family phosphatase